MTGRLNGKSVMVTGGGSGIGRAICELFAREGALVAILDIDEQAAQETLMLLNDNRHCTVTADVTKIDEVRRAFELAEEKFGKKCDILVNNAGIVGKQQTVSDLDEDTFDKVLNVNLKGIFLVAKVYLQSVKNVDKDVRGVIINMSSIGVKLNLARFGEYAAAKAGVTALTKTIANEYSIHRVRCNAVMPGPINTPMIAAVPPDVQDVTIRQIPMERLGTPEEVAYGFLYLASDESSYVHGATLEISGGL